MNFVADESVDQHIVERLRKDGHDVWYIAESEPGASDDSVLGSANERESLLLTADKDFGELVFRLRRVSTGVVLLRLSGLSPQGKARRVASAMNEHTRELPGSFSVIIAAAARIRRMAR